FATRQAHELRRRSPVCLRGGLRGVSGRGASALDELGRICRRVECTAASDDCEESVMATKSILQSFRFRAVVALLLLGSLYWHFDRKQVTFAVAELELFYLSMAARLFGPRMLVSALRWQRVVAPLCRISLLESLRQTLASSAWNLVTPSKLGDFSKAAMLPLDEATPRSKGAAVVAWGKLCDVAAICALWLAGYIGLAPETYTALVCEATLGAVFSLFPSAWRHSAAPGYGRWQSMVGTSLLLWCLHVVQID